MTLCTLTKNPIIHHQYYKNFQNQSKREFQNFHQMKVFLISKFRIMKMP